MGSASTNDLSSTRVVGPYRVIRRLAVGGMAEVFLARRGDGTRVVLKRPLPDVASDVSFREALEHEAAVTERLAHPGVVRTLGVERDASGPVLVLEYVDGTTLDVLLDQLHSEGRRLSTGTAVYIATELLDALGHAHAAVDASGHALGLVHRDVGPRNVLVGRDGRVKLTDFGIARSAVPKSRTRTGTVKGTMRYLAPEQATSSTIDTRTDVYAVGLVLFELLSGEPYLRGESEIELLRAAEDPPARKLPSDVMVDDAVRRALGAALARFPEERPASALSLRAKLLPCAGGASEAAAELAVLVAAAVPVETEPAEADVAHRSFRPLATAAAVLVLGAGVAFAWSARREVRAPAAQTDPVRVVIDRGPTSRPPAVTVAQGPAAPAPAERATDVARAAPRESTRADRSHSDVPPTSAPEPTATTPTTPSPEPAPAPATRAPLGRDAVRAKLARANAAIRDASTRGQDVARVSTLSGTALEAYAEGRYEEADRLLDRILADVEHGRDSVRSE